MPQEETKLRDGRIVRSESPLNLEMPFSALDSFITPAKSFYVRSHFPIPAIDRNAWWLHVEGEVEKPFAINYEQLTTLQCLTIRGDFGMRGEQPEFFRTKSERRAVAARRSQHRGMDRGATVGLARSSDSQVKRVRSSSGRSGPRHA